MGKFSSKFLQLAGLSVFITSFLMPATGQAQVGLNAAENAPAIRRTATEKKKSGQTEYTFVAAAGDALTYMVRRSIQLYSTTHRIQLQPAASIYAETSIVQELGSGCLEIGQQVTVPFTVLEKYTTAAKSLTSAQLAAWETYVPLVDFNVDRINPSGGMTTTGFNPADKASPDTGAQDKQVTDSPPPARDSAGSEPKGSKDQGVDAKKLALWAAIAAGVLFTLYFVLINNTSKDKNDTKTER